jgi:hypothetical protein
MKALRRAIFAGALCLAAQGAWAGSLSDEEMTRIKEMSKLLDLPKNPEELAPRDARYKALCNKATTRPSLGMTIPEARASTWCFPWKIHKTTTAAGEHLQEEYQFGGSFQPPGPRSQHGYLYFENGVVTAIQE